MNSQGINDFEGEEKYKDLFDNAHDLIHIAEPDGRLLYVNNSWLNSLEYSEKEISGRSVFEFVTESDRQKFRDYRNQMFLTEKQDQQITITLIAKSGRQIIVEGFVSVKKKNGNPVYTRAIFRDITAKIRNELRLHQYHEELEEREESLRQLLLNAPDAIIVIDGDSRIRYWNPKAEEVFGWKKEEVMGRSLADKIIPPEFREAHTNGMKRYLSSGEARMLNKTIDIIALNKTENRFYISLTISEVKQKGEISFIAFIRDISVQKKNELELERKRTELEQSNKELEQFAHVASHDMKEPVRKIRLFASRLEAEFENSISPQAKLYLDKVTEAAERLNHMVDGVLNYSTINQTQAVFEIINLAGIIQEVEKDLELIIAEKKAVIICEGNESFQGIPFLIHQLFYNLIINSLKFSKPNLNPQIRIEVKKLIAEQACQHAGIEIPAPCISIDLKDNGIGFDQAFAEKIFKSFTRLHARNEYEGTGLGLTLCRSIVERHHGSIHASSRGEGEGAQFHIILPIKQTEGFPGK